MNPSTENRAKVGTLLIALAGVEFLWLAFIDKDFMRGNVKVLSSTVLVIGLLCAVCGLFLVAGGRLAAAAYSAAGLAEPPFVHAKSGAMRAGLRTLTWGLSVCALWNLSVGWLFFPTGGYPGGAGEVYRLVFFAFIVYGVIPLILAPFCARGKRWALWTVSVFYLLLCVAIPLASGFVEPEIPSNMKSLGYTASKQVNVGAVAYLCASGLAGILAAFMLFLGYRERTAES